MMLRVQRCRRLTGAVRIRAVDAIAIRFGRTITANGRETKRAASEVEAERVRFFYEWKGSHPLPSRAPGELFVVEVHRFRDIPRGFATVPLIPL